LDTVSLHNKTDIFFINTLSTIFEILQI